MAFQLKISPQAHNDIAEIYNYVSKDGVSIAEKQVTLIYEAIERLADFPDIGKNLSNIISKANGYKYIIIRKVYLAFYRIENCDVKVIRILRGESDYIKQLGLIKKDIE